MKLQNALFLLFLATPALAGPPATPSAKADPSMGEEVEISKIKKKYWAMGDEAEVGVVQNRVYTKNEKFDFGLFGGVINSDPFLNVKGLGASAGYFMSEYFAVHLLFWKHFVSDSSALTTFKKENNATTNTNEPRNYLGLEGQASLLYGKLSVMGKAIIYFDMHALMGVGATTTESGVYPTPSMGIGQKIYLSKVVSFRLDYRAMLYRETILEKVVASGLPPLGTPIAKRNNFTNAITVGVTFLLGSMKDEGKSDAEKAKKI